MKLFARLVLLSVLGVCRAGYLSLPLKISSTFNGSGELLLDRRESLVHGISLASQPAGAVSFVNMVNNLKGDVGRGYYLEIQMGTPAQKMNILVDTGSSNFAVAAAPNGDMVTYFKPELSSTYKPLNRDVSVRYTQGSWMGRLGTDVVTIPKGPNGTVTINIAIIMESENFFLPGINWQGILGLAYSTLAKPSSSVEPFFDSLVKHMGIPDVFSLQMCGAGLSLVAVEQASPVGGSLIMGGIEPNLYKGDIWYTPIKEEWYYQIEVLKLEVGGQNLNLDCTEYNADKAIVDSGTTLLRLPMNVFVAVTMAIKQTSKSAVQAWCAAFYTGPATRAGNPWSPPVAPSSGASMYVSVNLIDSTSGLKFPSVQPLGGVEQFVDGFWAGSQLACWTQGTTPWSFFPQISIYLRGENSTQSFRITILPQLYIQPLADIGDSMECYRFGISSSTNGLVLGATVMEGFYVVFDRAQQRVGFAASSCGVIDGSTVSEIAGPFSATDVSNNCISKRPRTEPALWIISYALIALCCITILISVILLVIPWGHQNGNGLTDDSSLIRHRWK